MKYIKFGTHTGEENMRIDSDLLDKAIENQTQEPIFRLYAWSPKCVSLGRNQGAGVNTSNNINENSFKDIDVVRRVTGGRALLHDNEITYSYISPASTIPNGQTIKESYKYISGILIDFFKTLGVELDFGGNNTKPSPLEGEGARRAGEGLKNNKISTHHDYCMLISTGADVCYNGKKIIGSAQYRKNGYILQHGSILFGYDKDLLEELFHEEVSPDSITTVNEILPQLTKEEFVEKFEKFIQKL